MQKIAVVNDLQSKKKQLSALLPTGTNTSGITIRKNTPTCSDDGTSHVAQRTATKRRSETLHSAMAIHGASQAMSTATAEGLADALNTKFPKQTLVNVVSRKRKLCDQVFPAIYSKECKNYEVSNDNMVRSVNIYYAKGVMGKRKYRSVYKSLTMKKSKQAGKKFERIKVMSCPIPRLVSYNKLTKFISTIDMGYVGSVRETFCSDLEEEQKVNGCFRDLTLFLPVLASFYFKVEKATGEKLLWFGKENTFKVCLGGDGAPFGKHDTSCSWLVSFLNRGKHILSSSENFLIFGANCGEESIPVCRYISKLVTDILMIEKSVYNVDGKQVKFEFTELLCDLKLLAFLAGELPVSAKYFSTFGSVNTDDCMDLNGTYGSQKNDKWKPWLYSSRMSMANKVRAYKCKIVKEKLAQTTSRSKITTFIASKKHRQEFEPRIGKLIDKAHIDPLHCKNNACQQVFRQLLYHAIGKSKLAENVVNFNSIPVGCPFTTLVSCLRQKAQLGRLAKKIVKWFQETKGKGKQFEYRFTGRDSRLLLHNFMFLIEAVECENDTLEQTFFLHLLSFVLLELRECVSLFCRVTIDSTDIQQLSIHCSNFFRAMSIFRSVSPTIWNLGHVIPNHTQDVYNKYQLGLGVVSMEGREAKHLQITNYSKNAQFNGRWEQIFRHEFVQLVWLRERGYFVEDNTKYKLKYIPARTKEPAYCFCGLGKGEGDEGCRYCTHTFRAQVQNSVKNGKNLTSIV